MKNIGSVKTIVKGIGVYTALSLVASFCNFLFNFILIRLLSAHEFRDLTIANNMINVFGNLFVALNIVSIALFYVSKERQADVIRACQKVIYVMYVGLLAVCAIFNSQAQQRTGLHDAVVLDLALAVIFCSIPVMILNAIYLGTNRFNKSAILNVSLAFGRLLLGVIGAVVLATHKDVASVAGILLVFVVVFGLFTLSEKAEHRKRDKEIFMRIWDAPMHVLKQHRSLVVSSVIYAATINFMLGMDIFMFGQFFTNDQSADYAAVSVIGKLVFFFISPISIYLAAKQQELIHTKPRTALKTSIGVNALVICVAVTLALLPTAIITLLIHRSAANINHTYLILSLVFNAAVVLTNHQIIEAIVGKRQKLVVCIAAALLLINGSLFLFFKDIRQHIHGYADAAIALGIPAITMLVAVIVLFVATHLLRRRPVAQQTT